MRNRRQIVPALGLVGVVAFATYTVVQLNGQSAAITGNFTSAATAEVKDAQGVVVLRGTFQQVAEEDDDIERKATLEPAGADTDATGEAEIEFAQNAPSEQEVEFSVSKVAPGAEFTFVIDGTVVGRAKADSKGEVELELDVRMPDTAASR